MALFSVLKAGKKKVESAELKKQIYVLYIGLCEICYKIFRLFFLFLKFCVFPF